MQDDNATLDNAPVSGAEDLEILEGPNTTPEETQAAVSSRRATNKGRKAIAKQAKQLERLTVEYLPIDKIFPNPYNPNRQNEHEFEMLCRSMEEDGFTQPVIVTKDLQIVDGEHRWRAAQTLGYKEIPIVRVDMEAEQARIATVRHNRARGSHDVNLEADLYRDLERLGALEWAKDSLMLDDIEVERLINDMKVTDLYAGESFSEAWTPSSFTQEELDLMHMGAEASAQSRTDADGNTVIAAHSQEVADLQRKREELLARAQSEHEREMIRENTRVYRINLMFSAEQAEVIKAVLEPKPADNLYKLCLDKLKHDQAENQ